MKIEAKLKTNRRAPPWQLAIGVLWSAVLSTAPASATAQDLNAMLRQKNCFACHAWDKKLVGPAYNNVRARYSASDLPQLVSKVLNGGRGVWGDISMPPNRTYVSTSEAQFLVAGILGVPVDVPLPSSSTYSPPPPPATAPSGGGGPTRSFGGGS